MESYFAKTTGEKFPQKKRGGENNKLEWAVTPTEPFHQLSISVEGEGKPFKGEGVNLKQRGGKNYHRILPRRGASL